MSPTRLKITFISGIAMLTTTYALKHKEIFADSIAGFFFGFSYALLGICIFYLAKQNLTRKQPHN
ncbi:hypothetical protein [Neptunitalea chrysea]|uniref:hypothetical protein n=1 Tax=Neptunitalea chrysea TaxID=1647581 RepID=UPI0024914587|nr:hypothetical protein [Neptunitalea chrysea]